MEFLKNKLKEIGASRHVDGEVAVLVELALRAPDKASLRRLEDIGLRVDEVLGNKVVGRIDSGLEPDLKALSFVAIVERSVDLKPHAGDEDAPS